MKKLISILTLLCFSFILLIFNADAQTVRVVYMPDKSVRIIWPQPNSKGVGETEKQWLERVFIEAMGKGLPYDDIDSSELPARADRNAWEGEKGKGISVNAQKVAAKNQEELIEKEMKKVIRKQAIKKLKQEGKLPEDYPEE